MRGALFVPSISPHTSIAGPLPPRCGPPVPGRYVWSSIGSMPRRRRRCATRRRCRARRGAAQRAAAMHPAPCRGGEPDYAARVRPHDRGVPPHGQSRPPPTRRARAPDPRWAGGACRRLPLGVPARLTGPLTLSHRPVRPRPSARHGPTGPPCRPQALGIEPAVRRGRPRRRCLGAGGR